MAAALACANCGYVIPPEYQNSPDETTCRGCGERVLARVFPASVATARGEAPASVQEEGEASCFYHPSNRAEVPCDRCGRFLCTLCALDLDGRRLCPGCLEHGLKVERPPSLEDRRVQYDSMALHLTIWPVFTVWLPLICAPAALYLCIRNWRTPMTILPRSRFRLWIALILAVAEIAGVIALIVFVVWATTQKGIA